MARPRPDRVTTWTWIAVGHLAAGDAAAALPWLEKLGLDFGMWLVLKAARQDPVEALRCE